MAGTQPVGARPTGLEPVFDRRSRVLILGSFPSVRSREEGFYYGHPRNRFWTVLAAVLDCAPPRDICAKRALLLEHSVALWDVAASCAIVGSGDSTIRDVFPNDLRPLLAACRIRGVFANGATAGALYHRLLLPQTGMAATVLPSTSPANASWQLARLIEAWRPVGEAARE